MNHSMVCLRVIGLNGRNSWASAWLEAAGVMTAAGVTGRKAPILVMCDPENSLDIMYAETVIDRVEALGYGNVNLEYFDGPEHDPYKAPECGSNLFAAMEAAQEHMDADDLEGK